jgi:hypothetical protein
VTPTAGVTAAKAAMATANPSAAAKTAPVPQAKSTAVRQADMVHATVTEAVAIAMMRFAAVSMPMAVMIAPGAAAVEAVEAVVGRIRPVAPIVPIPSGPVPRGIVGTDAGTSGQCQNRHAGADTAHQPICSFHRSHPSLACEIGARGAIASPSNIGSIDRIHSARLRHTLMRGVTIDLTWITTPAFRRRSNRTGGRLLAPPRGWYRGDGLV